jgi:hypothetical protein
MRRTALFISCLMLLPCIPHLLAQAPPPEEAASPPSPPSAESESTQERPADAPVAADPLAAWMTARNPFWPIGYEPPISMSDADRQRMQLQARAHWPKLQYTPPTRLPSGEMVTIIKGFGLVESGSIIRIEKNGLVYRWKITKIDESGLQAERLQLRAARP